MASPKRIFNIYQQLKVDAQSIHDFQVAAGEKVSGTVKLMLKGDAQWLLERWGEEMHEVCGVLDGTHDDPYIMEATQTFYWASCFAAVRGASWEDIDFPSLRLQGPKISIPDPGQLHTNIDRLVALGAEHIKPQKLFLFWCVADTLYRQVTKPELQRSLEEIMEVDLQDMKKRKYLLPVIEQVLEDQ